MSAFIDKFTLSDSSPLAPSIASANGLLYLCWRGDGNDNLNIACSSNYGRTFDNKYVASELSDQAPCLGVLDNVLYIAWTGKDNNQINIATVVTSGAKITGLSGKVVLGDISPSSPSLATAGGRIYVAWRGKDNNALNVITSLDKGRTFTSKFVSSEISVQAPTLCATADRVIVSWTGKDNNQINLSFLDFANGKVTGFSNKTVLSEISSYSPSVGFFNNQVYLCWVGKDNDNLNVMQSTDEGRTFTGKYVSSEATSQPVSLCAFGRILAIAWRGKSNESLNIAQAANVFENGTMRPLYKILTLIYAPPGTNGGKSVSSVVYSNGSSTGTTNSISKTFKDGIDVTASLTLGDGKGPGGGLSAEFSTSKSTTDASSFNFQKSNTFTISVPGPPLDGLDHDEDRFYLWLNPLINVSVDPENNVAWGLGVNGPNMDIVYVTVAQLKTPASMPPDLQTQLKNAGLGASDYKAILATNPFANGGTAIDPGRYRPTGQTLPYEPPDSATGSTGTSAITLVSTTSQAQTHTSQVDYAVSATLSATNIPIVAGVLNFGAKTTGTLQWTNTTSSGTTSGTTQSAAATVGGPAFGYTGKIASVIVYWDTIYNSFMFAPQQ